MFIAVTEEKFWLVFGENDGMALSLFLRVEGGQQFAEWFDVADGDPSTNPSASPLESIDLTDAGDDPALIEARIAVYYGALDLYDPAIHGAQDTSANEETDDAEADDAPSSRRNTPSCDLALKLIVKNAAKGRVDLWTERDRTELNLCAMETLATIDPGEFTDDDRKVLRFYSGWGGLSRAEVMDRFPEGLPIPEERGLLHEYYTPTIVAQECARLVRERLATLPRPPVTEGEAQGPVIALEPSAGIGRFIDALGEDVVDWTAVEWSEVSGRLLQALHPEMDVFSGPFEQWIAKESHAVGGKVGLVLSNPPYPKIRGVAKSFDPHKDYEETAASAYFLRRGLDLLAANGLGIYLIPAGFMGGKGDASRTLREKVLKRHHIAAAFRLPSTTFPGANLVIDLIVFRARGGQTGGVLPSDQFILEGRYFKQFPSHVLGTEEGSEDRTDEETNDKSETVPAKKRGRFGKDRYKVIGKFTKLPPFTDRPMETVPLTAFSQPMPPVEKIRKRHQHVDVSGMGAALAQGIRLGARVDRYFSLLSSAQSKAHVEAWPELFADLTAWAQTHGNPHENSDIAMQSAAQNVDAQAFLHAFTPAGTLTPEIAKRPTWEGHYNGKATDVSGIANYLYRGGSALTLDSIAARLATEAGKTQDEAVVIVEAALPDLYNGGWRLEGDSWRELLPTAQSLMGSLWPRYDRCEALAKASPDASHPALRDGKVWGSLTLDRVGEQARELLATIEPQGYEDLLNEIQKRIAKYGGNGRGDIDPSQGWAPIDLVSEWLSEWALADMQSALGGMSRRKRTELNNEIEAFGGIKLARKYGMLMPSDVEPSDPSIASVIDELYGNKVRLFIGWANLDTSLFTIRATENEIDSGYTTEMKRRDWETPVLENFRAWCSATTERQTKVENAYNRTFRGILPRVYSAEPLHIERWGAKIQLNAHQTRGVRKVIANRSGLLAFDVGVGKTFAGIASIARARQEGWARRPIILVPNTIVWKWDKDFKLCLPDYRVLVVGSSETEIPMDKVYPVNKKTDESQDPTIIVYDPDGTKRRVHRFNDTPVERGEKWRQFQAGNYDVAIVAYSMLDRTELDAKFIQDYALRTAAIQRDIQSNLRSAKGSADAIAAHEHALANDPEYAKLFRAYTAAMAVYQTTKKGKRPTRPAMKKPKGGKKPSSPREDSERDIAVSNEVVAAWVAKVNTLPEKQQYDHGIRWDDIGIDMIVVDEAQNFKNLYLPESRTNNGPWKFMGNSGSGAKRAWQLDFRCESIRKRNGGAGIVLLSATPAKNSPLEFYNIIQYMDHGIWERSGISNPEAFIDRYIVPGPGYFASAAGDLREGTVAKGFKNLDEIRGTIFRYGDFVTAEDAGIKLPLTTTHYLADDGRSYRTEIREATEVTLDDDGKEVREKETVWFDADGKETFITQVGLTMTEEQRAADDRWRGEAAAATRKDPGKALRAMSMRHALSTHLSLCDRATVEKREKGPDGKMGPVMMIGAGGKEVAETEEVAFWTWDNAHENPNYSSVKFESCAKAIVKRLSCGQVLITDDAEETLAMLVNTGVQRDKIQHIPDDTATVDFSRFPLGRMRKPGDYEVLVCSPETYVRHKIVEHVCAAHDLIEKTEEQRAEMCKIAFRARTCGHIIFVESVPSHIWIRKVLVDHGIPENRIAILNAESAPDPSDRQDIAERFNGNPDAKLEPEFDVVICNAVAYEGIDLQARTCAIHHIDLPHDPSTLQQRNGRGVRQGNTMGGIEINYYFLQCSDDGSRFTNINGKRGWMVSLLSGQDRDTNNPAVGMSPLDMLALLTCDVNVAKAMFAAKAKEKAEKEKKGKLSLIVNALRVANSKFRRAEWLTTPESIGFARAQGEEALLKAAGLAARVQWDWSTVALMVRDRPMLIPDNQPWPLLCEGMKARFARENLHVEFGKQAEGGKGIAATYYRKNIATDMENGYGLLWSNVVYLKELDDDSLRENIVVDGLPGAELGWVDYDAAIFPALARRATRYPLWKLWNEQNLYLASDEWLERLWSAVGQELVMKSHYRAPFYYEKRHRFLFLRRGEGFTIGDRADVEQFGEVIAPTKRGYDEFLARLALTPRSALVDGSGNPLENEEGEEYGFAEMFNAVQAWWGFALPKGVYILDK